MSRIALRRVHLAASLAAFGIVAAYVSATVAVEALGSESEIESVKHWIVRALAILVPTMAAAGLSGRRLGGTSRAPVVRRKLRRMKVIGATGILVLVPCAFTLDHLAANGRFDAAFAIVQFVELAAGATNLTLLGLNFRDGMAMRAKRGNPRRAAASMS